MGEAETRREVRRPEASPRRPPGAATMAGRGGTVLATRVGMVRNGNRSRHHFDIVSCAADRPVGRPATPVVVCHSACEMGRRRGLDYGHSTGIAGERTHALRGAARGTDGPGLSTSRLRRRPWLCSRVRVLRPESRLGAGRPATLIYRKFWCDRFPQKSSIDDKHRP